jgi:integrase
LIPKLNKYQINKYLKEIEKENTEYAIILKLAYIYGKNIEEIINIQKTDIKEKTITIKQTSITQTYPITQTLKKQLQQIKTDNE